MLVWLLKKINLPENRIRKLVEKLTRVKIVASAVFYTVMVFIVVFGISGDVYAGFPRLVPYIIIAVFLFMAFIRMYQCMVDDSYIREIAAKKVDENEKRRREKEQKAAKKIDADAASADKKQKKPAQNQPTECIPEAESASSDEKEKYAREAVSGELPESSAASVNVQSLPE